MMPLVFYIVLLLTVGWLLALKRKRWWARFMIIASVPVGAFLGGYCGSSICSLVLHLQGRGESHNDLISFAVAGVFGMLVGGIVAPLVALFLTKPKKDDDVVR
jgi:hypothetical protein